MSRGQVAVKLVYTHPSLIVVAQARSTLEFAGLKCEVRNEFAAGAIGELAPIDAWPELWVVNDRDAERAVRLLEQSQVAAQKDDWRCRHCDQPNPSTFEFCWHCAADKPDAASGDARKTPGGESL